VFPNARSRARRRRMTSTGAGHSALARAAFSGGEVMVEDG
jgi:hypothetical protein